MALIKCPECGKKISDKATTCPNCGCPIKNNSTETVIKNEKVRPNSEPQNEETISPKKKKKKFIPIIILSIFVICGGVGILFFFNKNNVKLTNEEKIGILVMQNIAKELGNPDSIVVDEMSIIFYDKSKIDDGFLKYLYTLKYPANFEYAIKATYSYENEMGGMSKNKDYYGAIFIDGSSALYKNFSDSKAYYEYEFAFSSTTEKPIELDVNVINNNLKANVKNDVISYLESLPETETREYETEETKSAYDRLNETEKSVYKLLESVKGYFTKPNGIKLVSGTYSLSADYKFLYCGIRLSTGIEYFLITEGEMLNVEDGKSLEYAQEKEDYLNYDLINEAIEEGF